jgi:hypothetical protein
LIRLFADGETMIVTADGLVALPKIDLEFGSKDQPGSNQSSRCRLDGSSDNFFTPSIVN